MSKNTKTKSQPKESTCPLFDSCPVRFEQAGKICEADPEECTRYQDHLAMIS